MIDEIEQPLPAQPQQMPALESQPSLPFNDEPPEDTPVKQARPKRTQQNIYDAAATDIRRRFDNLTDQLKALGDDVTVNWRQTSVAFRRKHNFASVTLQRSGVILIYAPLDPDTVDLQLGFTRDVRNVGHHGTGDLEITIKSEADVDKAMALLAQSYATS